MDTQQALQDACQYGNIDTLTSLLTSPLSDVNDIHVNDDVALHIACENNQLDVVKFLLTSPKLQQHANVHARGNWALKTSCANGYLDIVDYLLSTQKFSPDEISAGFEFACYEQQSVIIRYFLYHDCFRHMLNYQRGYDYVCMSGHHDLIVELLDVNDTIDIMLSEYDIQWAIDHNYTIILEKMMYSLFRRDIIAYMQNRSVVERYCLENDENFKTWEEKFHHNNIDVNTVVPHLFL